MQFLIHGKFPLWKFFHLKYINIALEAAPKTHSNGTGASLKEFVSYHRKFYPDKLEMGRKSLVPANKDGDKCGI